MFLCPVLGLQAHAVFAALSGFYVNAGDLDSDPHTCVADILPTEPLHQPQVPVKPQYCFSLKVRPRVTEKAEKQHTS